MKRLNHPNIIQFIEVYETPNELMMVMEYCPGDELFDVILARRFFSEHDAKPLFYQIAKALHYLHCLNIIHRDIKPENVLVLHKPDPMTNLPIAKLLDFGLSKNAGGGSAAKTFVGTPCYLAPEVEYTSKGLGGTYGLPADCWSLGAVLYVMLVARFPEFGHTANGEVVLRLPPALWDDISSEAKDLIRKLMTVNPDQRYTVAQVLQHPWLGSYKLSDYDLRQLSLSYQHAVRGIEQQQKQLHDYDIEEKMIVQKQYHDENIEDYEPTTMVVRPADSVVTRPTTAELFPLAPLLHLQRSLYNYLSLQWLYLL
jgi:calcium-dependent protein kinase